VATASETAACVNSSMPNKARRTASTNLCQLSGPHLRWMVFIFARTLSMELKSGEPGILSNGNGLLPTWQCCVCLTPALVLRTGDLFAAPSSVNRAIHEEAAVAARNNVTIKRAPQELSLGKYRRRWPSGGLECQCVQSIRDICGGRTRRARNLEAWSSTPTQYTT
jgi:hypothetical protein